MPPLRRRRLLQVGVSSLALGLAGCIGAPRADTAHPESSDGDVTVEAIAPDGEFPLSLDAVHVGGGYTDPDQPLTIELTIENTANRLVQYGERRVAQFYYRRSDTPPEQFVLWPAERVADDVGESLDFVGGRWRRLTGLVVTGDFQVELLEPGDVVTTELYLLDDTIPDDAGADEGATSLPDTTEFSTTLTLNEETGFDQDSGPEYEWSLRLTT